MTNMEISKTHQKKAKLSEINLYLTCRLCKGYLIDATTISECLHSFCRSCIIKFLQDKSHCPVCEVVINKAKPNLKLDKTLQDIVYKLVPELFLKEMHRRQIFYQQHPDKAALVSPEQRGEDTERTIFNPRDTFSLAIEYVSDDSTPGAIVIPSLKSEPGKNGLNKEENLMRRFLQCPGMLRVDVLKKFVRNKYSVDTNRFHIEILYKRLPLPDFYTLIDVAYIFSWKRNEPMKLYFRITDIKLVKDCFDYIEPVVGRTAERQPPSTTKKVSFNVAEADDLRAKSPRGASQNLEEKQEAEATEKIKDQIKNGENLDYSNLTLDNQKDTPVITKIQKVSNKIGQAIGLKIKKVKKPNRCKEDKSVKAEIVKKSNKIIGASPVMKIEESKKVIELPSKKIDTSAKKMEDEEDDLSIKKFLEINSMKTEESKKSVEISTKKNVVNSIVEKADESTEKSANVTNKKIADVSIEKAADSPLKKKIDSPKKKEADMSPKKIENLVKKKIPEILPKEAVDVPIITISDSPLNTPPKKIIDTSTIIISDSPIKNTSEVLSMEVDGKKISAKENPEMPRKKLEVLFNDSTQSETKSMEISEGKTLNSAASQLDSKKPELTVPNKCESADKLSDKISNDTVQIKTSLPMELDDEKERFLKSIELTARTVIETMAQSQRTVNQCEVNKTQKRKASNLVRSEKIKKPKIEKKPLIKRQKVPKALKKSQTQASSDKLQNLLNSCKIPHSLSITCVNGDYETQLKPVINHIEILKLPEVPKNDIDENKQKKELERVGTTMQVAGKEDKEKIEPMDTGKSELSITLTIEKNEEGNSKPVGVHPNLPKVIPISGSSSNRSIPQSFQKIFEETVKKKDSGKVNNIPQKNKTGEVSTTTGSNKRNILEIASQLYKKTKLEHEEKNKLAGNKMGASKVVAPKKDGQTTLANLHSANLGMNYSVSVNRNENKNVQKAETDPHLKPSLIGSPKSVESKKNSLLKLPSSTVLISNGTGELKIPSNGLTKHGAKLSETLSKISPPFGKNSCKSPHVSPKTAKTPGISPKSSGVSPKSPTVSPKLQNSSPVQMSKELTPPVSISSTKPLQLPPKIITNNIPKVSHPITSTSSQKLTSPNSTAKVSTSLPSKITLSPKVSSPKSHSPKASVSSSTSPRSSTSRPTTSTSSPAYDPNQILEKYNIQNLAQLTASFNLNPATLNLSPTSQLAAIQQAMILKQLEYQNRNWLCMNSNPLVQYEKYLQSLSNGSNGQNHILGNIKEN